jgi:hypothetical protein
MRSWKIPKGYGKFSIASHENDHHNIADTLDPVAATQFSFYHLDPF